MTGVFGTFPCAVIFSRSSFTTEISQCNLWILLPVECLPNTACEKIGVTLYTGGSRGVWGEAAASSSGVRLARSLLLGTTHCLLAAERHPRGNTPVSSPVYRHVSPIIWQGKLLSGTPKRLLTPGRGYFKMLLCQNNFSSFPFLPGNHFKAQCKEKYIALLSFQKNSNGN